MGQNSNREEIFGASQYAAKRLSSDRDDRTSQDKIWADARLRGEVGTKRANEIIGAIDKIKMTR